VLFESGEEVDFALFPAAELGELSDVDAVFVLRPGYRVLLDRIGPAERFAELAARPREPPPRDLAQLSHDFWHHALWAAKKLRRGEVWIAWRSCNSYLQSVVVTLPSVARR